MSAFESSAVVRPGAEPAVAGSRETGIRETGHVRAVPPNMRGIRPGSYAGYPMNGMRLYACGGVECGCRSGLRWSVAPVKVCGMIARRPFAEQKSGPRALHVCAVCIWFASCAAEKGGASVGRREEEVHAGRKVLKGRRGSGRRFLLRCFEPVGRFFDFRCRYMRGHAGGEVVGCRFFIVSGSRPELRQGQFMETDASVRMPVSEAVRRIKKRKPGRGISPQTVFPSLT